ncbi:MAG TPA: type I DNA topoisomerase [Anaerolineae bacterium]
MKLVIVESPTKAKTLSRMLGTGYTVRASMGHVRDLPEKEMGIDIENGFKPSYHILRKKSKTLKELRGAIEKADELFLATDPDREGEAIAWHLLQALKPKVPVRRVEFHEITEPAIRDAFARPRSLDMELVNAQQARRVLDRLVGYQISPLLWKSTGGKSAGRVQSVALRLVVDREREILNFVPEEYWTIHADLAKRDDHAKHFLARLLQIGSKKVGLHQAVPLKTKEEAERVIADLRGAAYHVKDIRRKRQERRPWPPFTTSTLQQAASARLRMSPSETMKVAQELYEGVDIGEGKPVGLITYMRTDSTEIAPEAQAAARKMIEETLGREYLPAKPPQYKTRVKNAQEAHEAIRPTDVRRYPKTLKPHLSERQFQLYDLIWRRFVASQMAPALYDVTTVDVVARAISRAVEQSSSQVVGQSSSQVVGQADSHIVGQSNSHVARPADHKTDDYSTNDHSTNDHSTTRLYDYLFRAVGRVLIFDGFLRVWEEPEEKGDDEDKPQSLPVLAVNEPLDLLALIPKQHFTQPPPRYTEAALVKALEERGIGRPSTYATIINTLKQRTYVELDKRALRPTPLGEATCDALMVAFPDVMDYTFTANTEDWLDEVSRGEKNWVAALKDFYDPFARELKDAPGKMSAVRAPALPAKDTERKAHSPTRRKPKAQADPSVLCPRCGSPMVKRAGSRGEFWGCSRYPQCKGTRNIQSETRSTG